MDSIKTGKMYRSGTFDRATSQDEERRIVMSFVSEEPCERYFGLEVLCCDPGCIRTERLYKMPLLKDHDPAQQVGVVESVSFRDGRGYATVRFSKNRLATELWQDVIDGIRDGTSIGYNIYKMQPEQFDGKDGYRVIDWEPLEISLTALAMDPTVGINRQQSGEKTIETKILRRNFTMDMNKRNSEIRDILAMGKLHNRRDEAAEAINQGKTLDQFRSWLLDDLSKYDQPVVENPDPEIGLTSREANQFSFLRAIRSELTGDWGAAGFEREVIIATKQRARKMGRRDYLGLAIPPDILSYKRDLTVGTNSAGGYTVATNLLASSFIDILHNAMQVVNLGATSLTGLVGDVAIPKNSTAATGYWVAEGGDITESAPAFAQVTLSPKTVGGLTDLTRRLILQSSIDVESFVRRHLATILALAIDLAAINGSGSSNQPTGILQTSGIGSVVGGTDGAAPEWADVVDLESAVSLDNAAIGSLGYLTNSKVVGKLKQTEKASNTGKFVLEKNNELNGYKLAMSNQVPSDLTKGSSSNCSAIIFGNWADLLIGTWGGLDVVVDRSTFSASGGVRIAVFQDVDIAVRHAESFAAMQDVLTS